MDIHEAVRSVIEAIPAGHVFDSHYVVDGLKAEEASTDAYLELARGLKATSRLTLATHRRIGHIIDSFAGTLIERMPHESWSMTIHHRGGKCALWRRI